MHAAVARIGCTRSHQEVYRAIRARGLVKRGAGVLASYAVGDGGCERRGVAGWDLDGLVDTLQGKVQKHENFVAELNANQTRVEGVLRAGNELIEADHYAKDTVK